MFLVHKRNVTERCFFTKEFIDSYQKFINRPFSLNPVFCKILLELASISNKQSSNFRDFTVFKFWLISVLFSDYKKYRRDPTDINLSCLESFSFDYVVKWPVSLVVNRKVSSTTVLPAKSDSDIMLFTKLSGTCNR